jgi:hypothetical protein
MTIDVNFELAGKQISTIKLGRWNFVDFVSTYLRASEQVTPTTTFQAALQRERFLSHVHFISGQERVVPTLEQLLTVPFTAIRAVTSVWDNNEGASGSIIGSGDGVTAPLLYKLGTPLAVTQGGEQKAITELEFLATTYGQLEDVLTAGSDVLKALELIKTVANPVEMEQLTRLTGFMVDGITIADGVTIMQKVLPRF